MSYVTNVILALPKNEEDKLHSICDEFNVELSRLVGDGPKVVEKPTYIAAFDHFDIDKFVRFVLGLNWESPEEVQILVCDQHDDRYVSYQSDPITPS